MKNVSIVLGLTLLSAFLITPGIAGAHGWGMGGGHMMGYWGGGPGYDDQDDGEYSTLTRDQLERLWGLDRKFYDETRELRDRLWSKSAELNALLSETNPDSGKIIKLQKEISDLRARLDEKKINYDIEARKITPDIRFGGGYGYGHMMDGYGMGYGMGNGPGACWN
ncbi:MAG: periplasmic heavy metal sensor [Thermodesulfobacteriota bacterium]